MQLADGGTLFLDEIGHLPLPLQAKLLRALEERSIRRVGGTRNIPFDVRLIAATHVELAAAVKRGEFREDLFYRLNVLPIELPALRERVDDIVPLAEHFLARFKREYDMPDIELSSAAKRVLLERRWSGNVRELRNTIERAVLLADGATLDASDVAEESAPAASGGNGALPFPATIAAITQAAARRMLELCNGNKSVAARRLGIPRPRLQRLLDATLDQLERDDEFCLLCISSAPHSCSKAFSCLVTAGWLRPSSSATLVRFPLRAILINVCRKSRFIIYTTDLKFRRQLLNLSKIKHRPIYTDIFFANIAASAFADSTFHVHFQGGNNILCLETHFFQGLQYEKGQNPEIRDEHLQPLNQEQPYKTCPECGARFEREYAFCPYCGSKL
jgi:hypothetical protein